MTPTQTPSTTLRLATLTGAAVLATIGIGVIAWLATGMPSEAKPRGVNKAAGTPAPECANGNGGITLPPGFCATVFADDIGHARHLVVAPNGVVYVNTWSGRYYGNATPHAGGFLVALQDTDGDGRADVNVRFGPDAASGNAGGTGIAFYNGALFAETNDRIVRYALPAGTIAPTAPPEVIVSGLPLTGDHPMHPFEIDAQGALYVDLGSATNACQVENRMLNSPGIQPCTELETRAGIWRYDANRTGQRFSPAERFATGLRNGEGIAIDSAGRILATQHGRDQLEQNWPKLYTPEQGANEPAEELVQLERGADYGWPYCYYSLTQPEARPRPGVRRETGRRSGRAPRSERRSRCSPATGRPTISPSTTDSSFRPPTAAARSSPFTVRGTVRRSRRAGTTWCSSRSATAKPRGRTSSSRMASPERSRNQVRPRTAPRGSRSGPDGALYISDDQRGRIWRITYRGPATAKVAAAPPPASGGATSTAAALPPEGIHPDAGAQARRPAADAPGSDGRRGRPRQPHLSRPGGERAMRRLPRNERRGHTARPRPHQQQVALGRRQSPLDHPDHHRRRAGSQELPEPDAAEGRRRAHRCRSQGGGGLCLGHQPPTLGRCPQRRQSRLAGRRRPTFVPTDRRSTMRAQSRRC